MRPVNLLPPEMRPRMPGQGDPRVAWGVLGGLVVLLLLVVVSISYSNQAKTLNDEAAALRAEAERKQAAVALVPTKVDDVSEQVHTRTLMVGGLSAVRFPWNVAMKDLSKTLPPDVTLDTVNAVSAAAIDAADTDAIAAAGGASSSPQLTLSGCASGWVGYARVLTWLRQMPGVSDVRSSSSAIGSAVLGGEDAEAKRKENCGIAPLNFALVVTYAPKKADLLGLPKPEAEPASDGATGSTAGAAPAAAQVGG